ncbi:Protein NAP1 [Olea europaea subsp. europaea]|uniref:Protein NAP1 n=1 Tax=Olea europaea subsp. europaea TaxID=158383 RepID=A0A8S0T012_OLEEU|nr:Protein NAP1 [Olea europaea subsp. europaea]
MAPRKMVAPLRAQAGLSRKVLNMQLLYQLTQVAEGLMAKMYRLNQILDYPDLVSYIYSDAFWKSGVFPNHPKICFLLAKKLPVIHSKLQLERVDKFALDAMADSAEVHLQSLEQWIQLLLDLMTFREQALRHILDISNTVITMLELNFVSPQIGEVLEAVGPFVFLSTDTRKLRNERTQDLGNVAIENGCYLGILCVLISFLGSQALTLLCEVHEQSLLSCDAIYHERRILPKQEIGRMMLFFTDQPSLLASNIQELRKDWLSVLMIVTSS